MKRIRLTKLNAGLIPTFFFRCKSKLDPIKYWSQLSNGCQFATCVYTLDIQIFRYAIDIECCHMPSEPKIQSGNVGNSYRVIIPMNTISDLGWKEGDILQVGMEQNNLTIRKEK